MWASDKCTVRLVEDLSEVARFFGHHVDIQQVYYWNQSARLEEELSEAAIFSDYHAEIHKMFDLWCDGLTKTKLSYS